MIEKWLNLLSKCILFQNIENSELDMMLECLRPKINSYRKNECLTVAGETFTGVGLVLSGEVIVTKENSHGERMIMAVLGPGELFGEMVAFSKNKHWPATVIAQENSTAMFLPPEKIIGNCERQCISHKKLILNMLGIISDKALQLNRKVEYLAIRSIRGKICTFLMEQYQKSGQTTLMLGLNRNELADFLKITRPSLSREMCRMKEEGLIDFHRSSVQIKDIRALTRMSE